MDEDFFTVLDRIHDKGPLAVQANFARYWASSVAALASRGFITTQVGDEYTTRWRMTAAGLTWYERTHARWIEEDRP